MPRSQRSRASAKVWGRYVRASARDIARREYPRSYGATIDTACRCYLRGPDGVSGLTPSGTWGTRNIAPRKRLQRLRTADQLLRTADQMHFGLLTNCGLGD